MLLNSEFYFDIQGIRIAHEFTLNAIRRCEYPQGRGSYGLVYALDGYAQYRFFSGESITLEKGDVLLLTPDASYAIVTQGNFRHYTVNFDVHEQSVLPTSESACYLLLREKTDSVERAFGELVLTWNKKRTAYRMQTIGMLYKLLAQLCFEYSEQRGVCIDRSLQNAKEYIERHFDQPLRLDKLAYLSSMSVTNFRREWVRRYVQPPIQYRDALRLYYAKEYLHSGYYTVSEIAEKCGFGDVSYFVRFFKKQTGITPGEYKKRL